MRDSVILIEYDFKFCFRYVVFLCYRIPTVPSFQMSKRFPELSSVLVHRGVESVELVFAVSVKVYQVVEDCVKLGTIVAKFPPFTGEPVVISVNSPTYSFVEWAKIHSHIPLEV